MADIEDLGCFGEGEVVSMRKNVLEWYDRNQRTLPWRRRQVGEEDVDVVAYSVWVSEMMLQQTQVGRVKDYYVKWMNKWPTLNHLSQASQEEVNTLWAGLGYYRRARFLLEGAKHIMKYCNGTFPQTVNELQQIPGIGKYTAGAVASIAFNQAVPAVDANAIRILCRLRAISSDLRDSATTKLLWELAAQIVDVERPGQFNQALMDLGSGVCTSKSPSCEACPLSDFCKAFALEKDDETGSVSVTDFPVKLTKTARREEFTAVCVVELLGALETDSSFLLVQRPKNGLLAGLWEFPSVPVQNSKASARTRSASMNKYLKQSLALSLDNCCVKLRENVGTDTHVFSHIRLTMLVEWLQISTVDEYKAKAHPKTRWVKKSDIEKAGLTSGVKKVYNMVQQHRTKPMK